MKRPNVLWIQTDEQRPDSLGCYGETWARTPNIDRLAASGSTFLQCHVQSPMCVPSRTSMLTGTYPQETRVFSNAVQGQDGVLDPDMKAFPNVFADAGYRTCSNGKWHTPNHPTWQEKVSFYAFLDVADAVQLHPPFTDEEHRVIKNPGSFMDTVKIPVIIGGVYPYHDWGANPGSHLTDMSIEWLRRAATSDQPFLLRVSYAWPHTPVLVPRPWDAYYDPSEVKCRSLNRKAHDERSSYDRWLAGVELGMDMTMDQWRRCAADYYGLCAFLDHEVGRLMRALDELGLMDDTIVAYNADHGRGMGEYGHCQKGTFDTQVWRVPFIVSWPGHVPAGEVRDDLCELMDFGATLCALAGLDVPDGMRGRNLLDSAEPDAVFGVLDMFYTRRAAIRTREYRYDCTYLYAEQRCSGADLDPNLIRIADDPDEERNLAHDEAFASVAAELYGQLDRWMRIGG